MHCLAALAARRGSSLSSRPFATCGGSGIVVGMARSDVRDKLLSAGLEILHARGFNATGVQDITDAAGVPKGSFYNHFGSKDELGAAVVARYAELASAHRGSLLGRSGRPLARLRSYFKALNERGPATGFARGCLLGNFATELSAQSPAIRAAVAEVFAQWRAAVAEVIAEGQRAGEIGRETPAIALAGCLIDAWEGAVIRARVEKSSAPLTAFLAVTFRKILA